MERAADSSYHTLAALVSRLGVECPWTKEQHAMDMLYYTRKECLEVEEVLRVKPLVDTTELTKEVRAHGRA
jgi:NTP pyrophosphatase (non-canonical NTP hydrolase)